MSERESGSRDAELGAEVPEADAQEQRLAAVDTGDADEEVTDVPAEADAADRVEQARVVGVDEDEYR